ncbi:hypothetical protein Dimus_039072 [Dionaea muscipula]
MSTSSMTTAVFLPNVLLDEDNYPTWLFRVESFLRGLNLFGYIDGSIPCPAERLNATDGTSTLSPAYSTWKTQDQYIINMIGQTLSPMAMKSAVGSKSSAEMWKNLQAKFAAPDRQNILQLKENLAQIKKGDDSIEVFLEKIKTARDALTTVGATVDDEDLILTVLRGLPAEYGHAKLFLRNKTKCSMAELKSLLKGAEFDLLDAQKPSIMMPFTAMVAQNSPKSPPVPTPPGFAPLSHGSGPLSSQAPYTAAPIYSYVPPMSPMGAELTALFANEKNKGKAFQKNNGGFKGNSDGKNSPGNCQLCGQAGHIAKTCPSLSKFQASRSNASRVECQYCGRPFHTADKCYHLIGFPNQRSEPSEERQAENTVAMVAAATNDSTTGGFWLLDSGASHHMTNDIHMIKNVTSYPNSDGVVIGNGQGQGQNTLQRGS